LIQSANFKALDHARTLLLSNNNIYQVFFYFRGIEQIQDLALAEEWSYLIKASSSKLRLKVCKTEFEKIERIKLPHEFVLSSLIDFFSEHWQDQGILLQF
jgi:hypothetical protein